jgi:hypothetical protein
MTHTPHISTSFLQEANDRCYTASNLTRSLARIYLAHADSWRRIQAALGDTPTLTTEISRLHHELATARLDRANLAAAGRATLTACRHGEPDPCSYIRDELTAQGFWGERP